MIFRINTCLNFKQIVWISDMWFQTFRHFIKALEKCRINLLECRRNRIFFVNNIEVGISIVGIDNNFYGVSDIIRASRISVNRFGVRIIGTRCVSIHHPVKLSIYRNHIWICLIGKVRHNLSDSVDYISVNDNLGIAVDVRWNDQLKASFLDREKHSVEEVKLDTGFAFVHGVLVALPIRIVKFFFVCIYNDIFIWKFAEINFRTCNFDFFYLGFRRDVSDKNIRLSAACNLIYAR